MKRNSIILLIFFLMLSSFTVGCGEEASIPEEVPTLRLATTTSTQDSGLLNYILPEFEQEYNVKVEVLAQGTGQALQTASMGDADLVLVHSRKAEEEFVANGFGIQRFDVMYNDFVIVGPSDDPANIGGKEINEVFTIFTEGNGKFISRGDDSGTHKKENTFWEELQIEPNGDWYLSVGKGMGETLIMTNELQGYTLTDRGTYLFMLDKLDLKILVEGDDSLINPYSVMAVDPEKHPNVNNQDAQKLIDFLLSEKGQQMIGDYQVNGDPLFFPSGKSN